MGYRGLINELPPALNSASVAYTRLRHQIAMNSSVWYKRGVSLRPGVSRFEQARGSDDIV
jgi:hypothetical protein